MQTITFGDNKLMIKDHDTGKETVVDNVSEIKITCRKINTVDFKVMQHNYKRWDSDKGLVDEHMNWDVLDELFESEGLNDSPGRGGARKGAGRKKGTKVPLSDQTKRKISESLKGNKNAKKQ